MLFRSCIVIGLLTRFWSAGLVIAMLVALWAVHTKAWDADGVFSVAALVKAIEFQMALLAMAAGLFLGGPGRWAVGDVEGWVLGLDGGR